MVRFKNRYVQADLSIYDNFAGTEITEAEFRSALKDSIEENFGEFTQAKMITSIRIVHYNYHGRIIIMRCLRDYIDQLKGALFFLAKIKETDLKVSIIRSSGTLKKCEEKIKRYLFKYNSNLIKPVGESFKDFQT